MKQKKLLGLLIITLLVSGPLALIGQAQGPATIEESQISVAGVRGSNPLTRQLTLASDEPLTGIQIFPSDLTTADASRVFPASAIRAANETTIVTASAEGLVAIPVNFVLAGVPSGEFTGEITVVYNGGSATIPVTVKVKDRFWLPLLVLLIGIILGIGVSTYRAQVRPRDQILVRVSQLRAQIRADREMLAPFISRIDTILVDVEATIQAENWEGATQSVQQAEGVWLKWRRHSQDWLDQMRYHAQLLSRLNDDDLDAEGNYEREVYQHLDDIVRTLPDLDDPDDLRNSLRAIATKINDYAQIKVLEAKYHELCLDLAATEADYQEWMQKSQAYVNRVAALTPQDNKEHKQLLVDLQEDLSGVKQALAEAIRTTASPNPGMAFSTMASLTAGPEAIPSKRVTSAPAIRMIYGDDQVSAARNRLIIFTWASYVIIVAALAAMGFEQLYLDKATFGSNGWGDYFALMGWGFGAEATRASITSLLQGVGAEEKKVAPEATEA